MLLYVECLQLSSLNAKGVVRNLTRLTCWEVPGFGPRKISAYYDNVSYTWDGWRIGTSKMYGAGATLPSLRSVSVSDTGNCAYAARVRLRALTKLHFELRAHPNATQSRQYPDKVGCSHQALSHIMALAIVVPEPRCVDEPHSLKRLAG